MMSVDCLDDFMNVEMKYTLTNVNAITYFYDMVLRLLPLEDISVSTRSKPTMREGKLLDITRK